MILDPDTMIGAYKISGGGNGGFYTGLFVGLLLVALFLATIVPAGAIGAVAVAGAIGGTLAIGVLPSLILAAAVYETSTTGAITDQCFILGLISGVLLGLTLLTGFGLGALAGGAGGIIAAWATIVATTNSYIGNPISSLDQTRCL